MLFEAKKWGRLGVKLYSGVRSSLHCTLKSTLVFFSTCTICLLIPTPSTCSIRYTCSRTRGLVCKGGFEVSGTACGFLHSSSGLSVWGLDGPSLSRGLIWCGVEGVLGFMMSQDPQTVSHAIFAQYITTKLNWFRDFFGPFKLLFLG